MSDVLDDDEGMSVHHLLISLRRFHRKFHLGTDEVNLSGGTLQLRPISTFLGRTQCGAADRVKVREAAWYIGSVPLFPV